MKPTGKDFNNMNLPNRKLKILSGKSVEIKRRVAISKDIQILKKYTNMKHK